MSYPFVHCHGEDGVRPREKACSVGSQGRVDWVEMVVPWEAPRIGENVVECSTVLPLSYSDLSYLRKHSRYSSQEGILEADVDIFTR